VFGVPFDAGREREVFALEHDDADVNRLVDLARRVPPAGALSLDTGGVPARSPRYERLLQPLGFADDLRVAFVRDGLCWASLYAYRRAAPSPPTRSLCSGRSPGCSPTVSGWRCCAPTPTPPTTPRRPDCCCWRPTRASAP
jgi:hypothetical protein